MKRGFTLIELMVCIAVLVVIAALVMPSADSMSDATRFRAACDQLSSVASVCRAEAQRTGKPIAVVATRNLDGSQSIVGIPLGDAVDIEGESTIEVESKVLMHMPKGISIHAEHATDAGSMDITTEVMEVNVDPVDDATQSLIIYWANGAATASAPIKVKGPGGRVAGAKVNSFTGSVTVSEEPVAATTAAAEPEAEEPTETTASNDPDDSGSEGAAAPPDVSMDP
jgi:prepilin-type N-terminal cleavage/methylation domain-containing protein